MFDRSSNGKITFEELKHVMTNLGERLDDD